jgi:transcriptional regulator with XRE-family HTH domain
VARDPDHPTLGERVKELRAEQGLSQKALADILKKSVSWVSQVERGEIEVRDLGTLQRLAAALGATSRELVELQLGESAGEAERQRPYVEQLRLALAGHPAPQAVFGAPARRPAGIVIDRLREQVARAWELVHAAAYEDLGPLLAELIPKLELASRMRADDERRQVLALLSDAYQVAAAMLVKVGDHGAGWIAADRAIGAAERDGDRRLMMAGQYRMAHTLYGAEERALTMHVLRQAVASAGHLGPTDDAGLLSLTGACALLLAVLDAREGDAGAAERNLRVARQLAAHVGPGRNEYGTEFGPANVAVHAVSVAVELGNANDALRRAGAVDTDGLSPERRARFLVDVARAHAQRQQVDDAVRALERAEAIAPAEIRELRIVRQLVDDLEHFAGRRTIPGLRPLRQRITRR